MNKNAIKKYAVWARRELISRVSQKAYQYGIRENDIIDVNVDNIDGKILTDSEKKERRALIEQVNEKGFEQVIEEVAYTWFNRFSALRFMEVNGYLPTHVRVFTDEGNNFKPQIITEAIHMELDDLDMDKVYALKEADNNDELFKYLLITQCNALNEVLPGMFQRIADYTELLFPDNLLREGSVIEQMIALIPEDDWKDVVQIIGWLYQYYNSEPKDLVFANMKKKIKVTKENIPAATQLFTPDWIVRYMVENSLGRLWLEGHPDDELKSKWNYYLDEAEQEADVQKQLDKIREEHKAIKPEEIKVMDCCMGSGHILVYAFDVLMQIYEAYGFNQRDAAKSIVENNIFGLDIDERATQLAYFAVMMKARQYDRRFLSRKVQPHVYPICESNHLDPFCVEYFVNGNSKLKADMQTLIDDLHDAKDYGSILNITNVDFDAIYARFDEIKDEVSIYTELILNDLLLFVQSAQAMAQKYEVVCTNPPYMGSRKGMNLKLKQYVAKNYKDSKSDLYSCFIEKCLDFCEHHNYVGMITQQSFMFTDDYKELRVKLLTNHPFFNMLHLGEDAFPEINGEVVQPTTFIIGNKYPTEYKGTFVRLVDYSCDEKPKNVMNPQLHFYASSEKFVNIKAMPISYWISEKMRSSFDIGVPFEEYGRPRAGITTGKNDRFLRNWHEVCFENIGIGSESVQKFHATKKLYIPYNKGGLQVKWYGNNDYVIMFDEHNYNVLANQGNHLPSKQYYCQECITWSDISGRTFAARYCNKGFVFDVKGSCGFPDAENLWLVLAFLNSKLTPKYIDSLNPTTTTQVGDLKRIPILPLSDSEKEEIDSLSKGCMLLAKNDWDSYETSWDFKRHPLLMNLESLSDAYDAWFNFCENHFNKMKHSEERINQIFIGQYGMEDEMNELISENEINLRIADKTKEVKSLISYAVGCMLGRYSLDIDGLVYAGGVWSTSNYRRYPVNTDNIIPICDDEYFSDDLTGRFVKFIETVYGTAELEKNLKFIADALVGKGSSRDVIRSYFINNFYADHCKMYQKRPIYWLFDSGKKNGFKALSYMHRYQPDTIARMRTDYVHEQQERYRTAITHLEERINNAPTSERLKLNKQLGKLKDQATEIRTYEEKMHHLADQMIGIDLDDGVMKNYEVFKDVLAEIK